MSIHIEAKAGEIAPTVLLPGDPMRAKHFAKTFLEDAVCFNRVRGMLGYTGTYAGKRVSIIGSGMGMPSLSIYVHELINDYGVKTVMRVGTCGVMQPQIKIGDVILAMSSSSNSHVNRLRFNGMDYAPTADFELLLKAYQTAKQQEGHVFVGSILSSDTFYDDDPDAWRLWADYGVLAVEMETSALYTLAAKFKVSALSVLTASDSIVTGEAATSSEREQGYNRMAEIALQIAPA